MRGLDEFFEAWQQGDQLEIMVSPRPALQVFSNVLGKEKAIARYCVGKHMDALEQTPTWHYSLPPAGST